MRRDVLGRDFDHNPELVPTDAQTGVFSAQYDATLRLYVSEFNVRPPADIWGTPKFDIALVIGRHGPAAIVYEVAVDDAPLFACFDGTDGGPYADAMAEFGGGGGFSGGGGESSWGDAGSADPSPSDDGSSGCSSSCGGGGSTRAS